MQKIIDVIPMNKIQDYEQSLISYMHSNHKKLMDELASKKAIDSKLEEQLLKAINKFTTNYLA